MIKVFYDDVSVVTVEPVVKDCTVHYNGTLLNPIDATTFKIEALDVEQSHSISVNGIMVPIVMRGIVKTQWFENKYAYQGNLGSWVDDLGTHFSLWAPTALRVFVFIDGESNEMKRLESGVFVYASEHNLHGSSYVYEIHHHHEIVEITDPYAKASQANREASVVVDFNQVTQKSKQEINFKSPIIMEMSVRDFSMDPSVTFKNRGKFLGLLETHGDYGYGFVKDTGVTHVQLMPIVDFETVDELNPFENYNWGYDTMQFMSLEGSYSSNVLNPIQALEDLHKVVNQYHADNIGVNMDVVFNHIYELDNHPLHLSLPYYYFRYDESYNLSNGSFCGNEFATEMTMSRKIIIDSCLYFAEQFGIDGFRFDLMGLVDIQTMTTLTDEVKKINPNIMIYGEGWQMPSTLKVTQSATLNNASEMPHIGFFNDRFRDSLGGPVDGREAYKKLNKSHLETLLVEKSKVNNRYSQSINYIECHDNYTLADRMMLFDKTHEEAQKLTALVIISPGIPFLQIGQTFFRNKKGDENSYKSSDATNRIEWQSLDSYRDMNTFLINLIHIRKDLSDQDVIDKLTINENHTEFLDIEINY